MYVCKIVFKQYILYAYALYTHLCVYINIINHKDICIILPKKKKKKENQFERTRNCITVYLTDIWKSRKEQKEKEREKECIDGRGEDVRFFIIYRRVTQACRRTQSHYHRLSVLPEDSPVNKNKFRKIQIDKEKKNHMFQSKCINMSGGLYTHAHGVCCFCQTTVCRRQSRVTEVSARDACFNQTRATEVKCLA